MRLLHKLSRLTLEVFFSKVSTLFQQSQCFVHCRAPRIEGRTINLLKATRNQTKTAKLLRSKFDTINRIMHQSVARGMQRRSLGVIAHLRVDEKAFQRGHCYATMVADSKRGGVIDVGEDRDKARTKTRSNRLLGEKKGRIKTLATDMWKACMTTAQALFPRARLIHDRFHSIPYLNKGMDQVRRREVKQHKERKYSRHALLKNEQHRTQKQDEIFHVIQEANLQVGVAWWLRKEFRAIFECNPCPMQGSTSNAGLNV